MTDELRRTTDTSHLIDHWTRNIPGQPLLPAVPEPVVVDESERILAEREARKGLHPPVASVRRIR
ncbi:MAG TPA: hypothetical protein VID26_04215 [Candidatus Limnocylindrales bacterium]|jgi:hypothetical protein